MKFAIHHVDAFTNQLFGGNPAGVVSDARGLDEVTMQKIAREMNLSETAFVLPPQADDADMSLRFFTPTTEVKFCGHATVAALHQLAVLQQFGLHDSGKNTVTVYTKAGVLRMSVENTEQTTIQFTAPPVDMIAYADQGKTLAQRMGISPSVLAGTAQYDKALQYLYIPIASLATLRALSFDFELIKQQFADENIVVFCLYCPETIEAESALHARGLAPLVGVNEDPFTGSMQAGLLQAAKLQGFIAASATSARIEQGHSIGRPGYATVHHNIASNEITVAAEAVTAYSAQMELL